MPPSENDNSIEDQVKEFEKRDSFGQMNISNWSCLVLDVADILAPMVGKKGMELYYRIAQGYEAKETGWEGEEEAKFTAVMALYYVNLSLNEFVYINAKFGITVEPPPYPPDEPWIDIDVRFQMTSGSATFPIVIESVIAHLTPEEIERLAPITIALFLVYRVQNHPEYGTREVHFASIKTDDIGSIYYFLLLSAASPEKKLKVAQDIVDNKFTVFEYERIW